MREVTERPAMKEPHLRNTNPQVRENYLAYLDTIPFTAEHRPPLYGTNRKD